MADDALMAFVASISIEKLNCDGRFRGLFQRAISAWVPEKIAHRTTKANFANHTLSSSPLLRDLSHGRELSARGLVDSATLHMEFMSARDGTSFWPYLAAEQWLREAS
jgi:hypothetical protein